MSLEFDDICICWSAGLQKSLVLVMLWELSMCLTCLELDQVNLLLFQECLDDSYQH